MKKTKGGKLKFAIILFSVFLFFQTNNAYANNYEVISESSTSTIIKFYPNNNSFIYNVIGNANWDTIHNSNTGSGLISDYLEANTSKTSTNNYSISRAFLSFDTSIIPDDAEISKARLFLYAYEKKDDIKDGYDWLSIVKTNQVDPSNSVVLSDFNKCGEINYTKEGIDSNERKYISNININNYLIFNLNQKGINWIDKINPITSNDNTKGTLIGVREGHDIMNVDYIAGFSNYNYVDFHSTFAAGTDKDPYLEITYTKPVTKNPVVIVPGMLGSAKKNNLWKIDPTLHTYDKLIDSLQNNGYVLNTDLFLFPYNWRNDNNETAKYLKEKINEVKIQTSAKKVDIVAHSMGGLVARAYINSNDYSNDIDKLIFLGTPHIGSPESYLTTEGGYFNGGIESGLMQYYLGVEAGAKGYSNIPRYIKNYIPSLRQLLPITSYLNDKNNGIWQQRIYPNNYPINEFLENLNSSSSLMNLKQSVKITNIFGDKKINSNTTLNQINVISDQKLGDDKWEYGYPFGIEQNKLNNLIIGHGDGTVPEYSLNALKGIDKIIYNNYNHREIVSRSQDEVIKILTGKDPVVASSTWKSIKKLLFIRVFSPVDFVVIAPDGKMIGKNFASSTEINEIAEAYYSGFEEDAELATLINPIEGEYKVNLQGVDNGLYRVGFDILEDGVYDRNDHIYPGVINKNELETFEFKYNGTNEIEAVKLIDFKDIINDIKKLKDNKEIGNCITAKLLELHFDHLSDKYDDLQNAKNDHQREVIKKYLLNSLSIIEKELLFGKNKNWISVNAYDILEFDIGSIKEKID